MSEKKNPLPSIVAGTVFVLVLMFVGFVALGQLVFVLNPEDTPKLARTYKCKIVYNSLKGTKGKPTLSTKWASGYYTKAKEIQQLCLANKSYGKLMPKPKRSKKLLKAMAEMKKKAKAAKERMKNVVVGMKKKKKTKKKQDKKKPLTAAEKQKKLIKKCAGVKKAAFVTACSNDI